jgi:hypothetical protein
MRVSGLNFCEELEKERADKSYQSKNYQREKR